MEHRIDYQIVPNEMFNAVDRLVQKNEEQLEAYTDQLLWWNERVNLVSRGVSRETILKHIRHSLLVSQLDVFKKAALLVDTGTGGGLPGLPLAIAHPDKTFVLNDIVTKKTMAVRQMGQKLNLQNVKIIDKSIAKLAIPGPFLLLSKHAFKIDDLLQLTNSLPWTSMILYKGKSFEEELKHIKAALTISVYDLYENSNNDFYRDKVILTLSK